jgi:hypothetical protein
MRKGRSREITMGKSRGERRVIFSSSGAIHTTNASHLRRLFTGAATRARPRAPEAEETLRAAAGAERHHGDDMGRGSSGMVLLGLRALSIRSGSCG